jgi:glycosyltransferase involved in cell wall biosynthesis
MAVRGDAAELVREAGAGVLAEPGDPQSIAEAVRKLARLAPRERQELGQRGRRFYQERLSVASGVEQFAELFARVSRTRS